MRYLLMIHGNESAAATMSPEAARASTAAYMAYNEALKKAGALLGGDRLRPSSTATTIRVADGRTQVLDGPYAETKEQLGGYYMIEAPDLDAAIAWAAKCPGAGHGAIEVRPIWELAGTGYAA